MAIDKQKLLNSVAKMINEACDAEPKQIKSINGLENHICLKQAIDNIMLKESKNVNLANLCNSYLNALNNGQYDELLYESFISNASNYSYLNAVDTELSALNDRIKKYKQDVDLVKLLRLMEQTTSYYIVPLIEENVVTYMQDKTPNNRVMLRQALSAFQGDPYVKEINNVLNLDNSIPNNVYLGESYERANNIMHADTICSPVQYIKENESIFNVKGNYYVRKGNGVSKLSKANIAALPEDFRILCEAVNSPMVKFDMNSQSAEIADNNDFITVCNDGKLRYHGAALSESDYSDMKNISYMMNEGRNEFFRTVDIIKNNIADNIAVLDFVKHVELNESASKSVDVFKIKNNIFVTTIDESLGKTTFYRNVNPIQAKNLINEHMNLNVDKLFEDVLPDQKKIVEEIDDTSKQYEEYINELEEKKQTLSELQEENGDENADEIKEALKLVEDELEKTKKDYQDYKDSVKDYTDEPKDKEEEKPTDRFEEDPESAENGEGGEEAPGEDGEMIDGSLAGETEAELSQPVQADAAAGETSEDFPEFDPVLDAPTSNEGQSDDKFQIVKVSYNKNVKTGKVSNKGEVHILIPSVDVNGNLVDEMKKVTFYIGPDGNPVINNEYMPYDMYNAILNSIQECPETANATSEGGEDFFVDDQMGDTAQVSPDEAPDAQLDITIDSSDNDFLSDVLIDPETFGEEPEGEETPSEGDEAEAPVEDASADEPLTLSNAFDDRHLEDLKKEEDVEAKHFPIKLGISTGDLSKMNLSDAVIAKALNDRGVEYTKSEGGIMLNLKSKAEVFAVKDFLMNWAGIDEMDFLNKFPELMVAESVKIKGVDFINEAYERLEDDEDAVEVDVPYADDLYDKLEEEGFNILYDEDEDGFMTVTTSGLDDSKDLYHIIKNYVEDAEIDLESSDWDSVNEFLADFAEECDDLDDEDLAKSCLDDHGVIELPYDEDLISELDDAALYWEELDDEEGISVYVETEDEYKTLVDIIRSQNLEKYSEEVEDFVSCSESFSQFGKGLNEGMKIKITNDDTHETIEFDTDDLKKESSDKEEHKDNEDDVTFNDADSDLFGSDDEDEDKDSDDKGDHEKEEQNESEQTEAEKEAESKEAEKEEKPKKKFTFRPKKLHESAIYSVNESADPNVLDYVSYKGNKGQIISKYPNGNFIVNIKGSTVECAPSEIKLVSEKRDTLKPAFKFDKNTLKAIFESEMVRCGLFMNDVQITPSDCYVNYGEYVGANNNEDVRIILEGEKTTANKQYIKLLESVNDLVSEDDFVDGVEVAADGKALRNLKFNAKQYSLAETDDDMIDVILDANTPTVQIIQLPKGSLKSLAV